MSGQYADRSGLARYTHLIHSAEDFPMQSRRERTCGPLGWRSDFDKSTKPKWKKAIWDLLADRVPRTFNHIMLELTHGTHLADVAFKRAPDFALWELVAERKISHTLVAPILFRRTK